MSIVASFTLCRYPRGERRGAISRMALDRPLLRRTPGLRFARLLGTGRGPGFDLGADLSRWALFCVFDSLDAYRQFEAVSPVALRQRERASERFTCALEPLRWRGAWGGRDPLRDARPGAAGDGPVAVLTRAGIRARRLATFWRAATPVGRSLADHPGLLASVGIGEAPVVRQATFSIWRSHEEMEAFAYATPLHREAIARRRAERWYSEELFARFHPLWWEGSWDGRDPLSGAAPA